MSAHPQWSELYGARRKAAGRWPSVFRLPVAKSPGRVVAGVCEAGYSVLDVGAGARTLAASIAKHGPTVQYRSADPDPAHPHEFASLAAVIEAGETFDCVAALEVIEHLTLDAGLQLLRDISAVLKPGGVAVLSTPNIWTPGRFLRDATHITPWAYDELAGACSLAGLAPHAIHRTWNAAALPRFVRLWLAAPLHRYCGVDFTHSICVTARKPSAG
jgi:2-polyprenyl-3-methyl-5-hydroxy-6-metoxy-1,4-benzoquinol methylase